ncbi:MAG: molybdopterin biosynthesis protein [Anaerolineaceae bacterium]|nr:molybdopterin biosynthesis protein [Anaerolineaceae bacterium]
MSVYLNDIPLQEAQERLQKALSEAGLWQVLGEEEITLDEGALGRVLSRPVWARLSSPHYHAAAMDGFALRAEETAGAMPSNPRVLKTDEQAVYVDTGDPLPDWANAVVPIEQVEPVGAQGEPTDDLRHPIQIRIRMSLPPWTYVRPLGEDIVATQLILPAGSIVTPVSLGAIAASGHSTMWVSRKPRVAVLPTGTELVPVGHKVQRGDIIEYNSIVLAAQVNAWGGEAKRFTITPDRFELICEAVQRAADCYDLVLLNAGSSAGSEDFSSRVVEQLGELLVHGVAIRPGHPVILGMIRRSEQGGGAAKQVPIVGVPGYPVSAALTGEIFIQPLLARWTGNAAPLQPLEIEATLTRKVTSPAGDDDYMRVAVGEVGGRMLAAPASRGAGVITSLVRADGITVIPRGVQGLEAGAAVKVRLYRKPAELKNTIFVIGSHDMTLDVLAQYLTERGRRLVSANVGSQGGLVALRRGEAHLAGSHLLDPQTGEYNLSAIKQYLPNLPVRLVTWVGREQGLIVPKGNPKQIISLTDLTREDIHYINRQRGAGTRVLLDFHLQKMGIIPQDIRGYDQEEYTHLSVAAAVASGRGDCGLGVTAAAYALELDFVPLFHERYDLVIPCSFFEGDLLTPIFDLMADGEFLKAIHTLPGYDTSQMGNIVLDCWNNYADLFKGGL